MNSEKWYSPHARLHHSKEHSMRGRLLRCCSTWVTCCQLHVRISMKCMDSRYWPCYALSSSQSWCIMSLGMCIHLPLNAAPLLTAASSSVPETGHALWTKNRMTFILKFGWFKCEIKSITGWITVCWVWLSVMTKLGLLSVYICGKSV